MLLVIALMQVDRMSNEVLKQVFQDLYSDITSVNPDSVMDALFGNKVLSSDDYDRLRRVTVPRDRCRDMMSLLFNSKHRQAFIRLRLALLDEHQWLVDEIDKKLPSLTSQLQQLQLSDSKDGKALTFSTDYDFIGLLANFNILHSSFSSHYMLQQTTWHSPC